MGRSPSQGELKKFTIDLRHGVATAGGGVALMQFGYALLKNGFGDFLYMGVIPGTVGGSVCMNAGITSGVGKLRIGSLRLFALTPGSAFRTIE